jgi:hypothetical protein
MAVKHKVRVPARYSSPNARLTSAFIYLAVMAAKKKNPHAVALSKLRMLKTTPEQRSASSAIGGKASAESKTADERSEFGRKGGLKGGAARAAKLSPEERSDIAKKAAAARWEKKKAETAEKE